MILNAFKNYIASDPSQEEYDEGFGMMLCLVLFCFSFCRNLPYLVSGKQHVVFFKGKFVKVNLIAQLLHCIYSSILSLSKLFLK